MLSLFLVLCRSCCYVGVMQFNVRMFLHSLGNTSRHFRAVERPLSGRGSVDQSEATEYWRFPGLFRVMWFISSRNTNGPENQVEDSAEYSAGVQISLQVGFCSLFKPSYAWNRLPVKKQTTVVGLSG